MVLNYTHFVFLITQKILGKSFFFFFLTLVFCAGQELYQHLWEISHLVLGQIWQTCCTFCTQVFNSCLLFIWKSFDDIMTILEKVWNFVCAYISQFNNNIRRIWDSIGLALCLIIFIVVFVTGVIR